MPAFMTEVILVSEKMPMVFQDFPTALVTVTLGEGHKHCHDLKGLVTKYLCDKFHDCNGHSICENVNF